MSELNGTNFNFNPVGKNIQPKMVDSAKPVSEMPSNEQEQISDISTNHAEIIGRSMLANDTLKNDLDAILDNPTIADNSDINSSLVESSLVTSFFISTEKLIQHLQNN